MVVCAALVPFASGANAAKNRYVENFATAQYKDALNTTAWWDTVTGELKLFPFVPTLVGTCDTPGLPMASPSRETTPLWRMAVPGSR